VWVRVEYRASKLFGTFALRRVAAIGRAVLSIHPRRGGGAVSRIAHRHAKGVLDAVGV
jgi:hypothetical protein